METDMGNIVEKYETLYRSEKRGENESWADYRKRQDLVTYAFKDALEKEVFGSSLQMIDKKKLERLWDIAWSNGHSSGYNEVYLYYIEMSDLIDPYY